MTTRTLSAGNPYLGASSEGGGGEGGGGGGAGGGGGGLCIGVSRQAHALIVNLIRPVSLGQFLHVEKRQAINSQLAPRAQSQA